MAPYFKAINLTGDLYLTDTRLRYSDDMLTNNRYQQLKKHTTNNSNDSCDCSAECRFV